MRRLVLVISCLILICPFYVCRVGPNNTDKVCRYSNNKELKSLIHVSRLKPNNDPNHRPSLDPPPLDEPIDDAHYPPDPGIPQLPDAPLDATH